MTAEATVFVVDDDAAMRDSLSMLIRSVGLGVQTFASAGAFLDSREADRPGCLIADIRMPGMSGLELQERLTASADHMPVIILTGHGDVSTAVRAMKSGAVDFLQKPFQAERLLELIQHALEKDAAERDAADLRTRIARRLQTLTRREGEVARLVVAGRANKVIAIELQISERTVELHRARIMKKMRARSLAELVRMAPPEWLEPPA